MLHRLDRTAGRSPLPTTARESAEPPRRHVQQVGSAGCTSPLRRVRRAALVLIVISEIDLADGSVVATFPVQPAGSPDFAVTTWGDLDIDPQSGNLLVGSSSPESFFRVMTPDGAYVEVLPLRYYISGETTSFFSDVAGLALDPISRVLWVARRSGRVVPVEGIF